MKKTSILIVEDNKKLAAYLQDSLIAEGYHVLLEQQGDKASYRIVREQPDLVILDIMLPGMDGRQICNTVRLDYHGKILMLTALDDLQNEVDSLNLGADDYLSKPVSEQRLKARIKALLRRPSLACQQQVHTFGQLTIKLNEHVVLVGKQAIPLAPSEFDLLALLVKNQGVTLSRDTICYVLYGREYDGVDRGLDLKISRLRKALGDNKSEKIRTIRGKGYVFIGDDWK